jgi:transposase
MKRKPADPVFKPYVMHQRYLLPPSYDDLIEAEHLVRVVSAAIDKLDLRTLVAQYKGGGTSSYHPQMLLKVLVYAYSQKIYSSRKIAKALRENIHFMWISGEQRPDFRTINDFRGSRMKGVIDEVFAEVLEYLIEAGKVKLETYFVDGTKIEADANKHKVVWAKRKSTYHKRVRAQIDELLKQIEAENEAEQTEYGEKDLEERGGGEGGSAMDSEKLRERIERLNQRLRERQQPKKDTQATRKALKKLAEDCLPRLEKYEQQTETLAGRSSYSKTDPDASCMRMKEDRRAEKPWPKPAYNVQVGTEGQFITGSACISGSAIPRAYPEFRAVAQEHRRAPTQERLWPDAPTAAKRTTPIWSSRMRRTSSSTTPSTDTHHYRDAKVMRAHQFRPSTSPTIPSRPIYLPADKRLHFQYTSATPPTTAMSVTGATTNASTAPIACCGANVQKPRATARSYLLPLARIPQQARAN